MAKPATTIPHFVELIPSNLKVDFVRMMGPMLMFSWTIILIGLVSIYLRGGLNYGIDFAGGTLVHVKFPQATAVADLRAALEGPGVRELIVQDVGGAGQEFQIRLLAAEGENETTTAANAKAGLQAKFGEGSFEVLRVETVGPKVGKDLWRDATLAVLASTLLMGIYIWFRFDLRFGIGAAVALLHDVLITVALLSLFNMEFDLTTVSALLTVVGYSVHDTVIISDRIRENLTKMRKETLVTIVNRSINETLSRTIITSGTAILVTMSLFFLGGPVIHSFAFALLVGFTVGTYSSIYVAAPIVIWLEGKVGRTA
ncbi:MAG TPA: protein translocase subunit SecF [Candidatus Eisenbacteria bacterium]|nr:protein translocase subunit SecF [Candidatus Eisenbacteria bacterium]